MMKIKTLIVLVLGLSSTPALAGTSSPAGVSGPITLEKATQMALNADPRIEEQRANVAAAQALIEKVRGEGGVRFQSNLYLGLAPKAKDGVFTNGTNTCSTGTDCTLRSDSYKLDSGITMSAGLTASIIMPLYTFGKLENYETAAKLNRQVKDEEVSLAKGKTWLTVRRAYWGYLTARDTRRMLESVRNRVKDAEQSVQKKVDAGNGRMTDLYALQSGLALLDRYIAEARGVERVAIDGLKTIIGVPIADSITVADPHIKAVSMPGDSLQQYARDALANRPEMRMAQSGMAALRHYIAARKDERYPNLYAGVIASGQFTPGRDRIDNPYIFDPLNYGLATPVIGIKWKFNPGVVAANVSEAEARMQGVVAKAQLAQQGIPFQVSEAYHRMHSLKKQISALDRAKIASKRWMIASFLDFQAGLVDGSKLADAVKANATAEAEYFSAINHFNMQVAKLHIAMGDYPQ